MHVSTSYNGRLAGSAKRTRLADYSLGALRIVAGFLFIFHGIQKFFGPAAVDPRSLRAVAGVLECAGGPLLMLGLFTRPLAFLFSGEMAFAYFLNHAPDGFLGSFVEPNQEAAILNCFLFLFLWAAGPDEELTRLAGQGKLSTPAVFAAQVRRMLADPRAEALSTRFAAQWLRLRDVEEILPDALTFPYFDRTLALLEGEDLRGRLLCLSRWDVRADGSAEQLEAWLANHG